VFAFCGLANPAAFWATLQDLHLSVVGRRAYADHHRYSAHELRQIATRARDIGADALVTTQKDVMNHPAGQTTDLPLYWLEIEIFIDKEDQLLELVERALTDRILS
jgi:tetraacyldisaccharide 4'-kinase